MITETTFPHAMLRTLTQNITSHMLHISDKIADTSDPIERDELLAQLIIFQGTIALLTIASLEEDSFFLQKAVELLRS
jgi:hypothetical protein